MKKSSRKLLHGFFTAVIPFCDQRKGVDLLRSLGYKCDTLTAEMCMKATVENKGEFLRPFNKIAKEALASQKLAAYKKSLSPAIGDGTVSDKDIAEYVVGGVDTIVTVLDKFYPNETEKTKAEAEKLKAEAELERAKNQSTNDQSTNTNKTILYLGLGFGFVLIAIIVAVVLSKKKAA